MRSDKTETMTGVINSAGTPVSGPLTCRRTSPGVYALYPPANKRVVGLVAMAAAIAGDSWGWHFTIVDQDIGVGAPWRVAIANSSAGANVDRTFRYIVTMVA